MHSKAAITSLLLLTSPATALDVPANVRTFYNNLKAKGECTNKLASGFYDSKFDDGSMFCSRVSNTKLFRRLAHRAFL